MRTLSLRWPTREGRWRKPAIVAASVGLHAVVLGWMAFQGIREPRHYGEEGVIEDPLFDRPILIQMEPRPLLRGEVARTRQTPTPERMPNSLPDAGTRLTDTTGATGSADAGDRPSPPAPRFTTGPVAQGAPTPPADVGTAQWQVRREGLDDRVARGLRAGRVGCANQELLTRAERVLCDDGFGARASTAAPITGSGNAERDDAFARQGRRALAEYEARRRPLAGGVGIVGPQDGPGSNFGMGVAGAHLDPALRPDSTQNVRTRRDRIREVEED
jgi:hypothetical protein